MSKRLQPQRDEKMSAQGHHVCLFSSQKFTKLSIFFLHDSSYIKSCPCTMHLYILCLRWRIQKGVQGISTPYVFENLSFLMCKINEKWQLVHQHPFSEEPRLAPPFQSVWIWPWFGNLYKKIYLCALNTHLHMHGYSFSHAANSNFSNILRECN